ncbi:SPOR domain-containing protein [Fontimonas sp. SYSU GA230001]|uniref:SPOR domain-containing protein n=1 Tax=Fontimonas sp. SYSU GA230001 TaxID=3142450 RepID=UPI0032B407C2
MDEALKRRLIGAALLVLVAFAIASVLPEPQLRSAPQDGQQVVTIELREPEPTPVGRRTAPSDTPVPAPIATPPPVERSAEHGGDPDAPPEIVAGDRPDPVPASPAPTATPRPAPTPAASPALAAQVPAPTPPAERAGAGSPWWVQIGSYSDIANARLVESRMRALGQTVVIAPIDTPRGVLYRVRCGPYASQSAGQEAHARIVAAGYPEARLINP